jgi:hypothetical protein
MPTFQSGKEQIENAGVAEKNRVCKGFKNKVCKHYREEQILHGLYIRTEYAILTEQNRRFQSRTEYANRPEDPKVEESMQAIQNRKE